MTQSVLILGRQPALGLAELESLYGSDALRPLGKQAALLTVDPCLLAFGRLGGSMKFGKLLKVLDTTAWKQIEKFLVEVSPEHSKRMKEGKMQLGLSAIDMGVSIKQLEATGLTLKKAIRSTGRSVRLIPNKAAELNSAQVLHNNLTGPTGWELYFIRDGNRTLIAQTVKVQDIEAYTARDQARPKRDARVGMLPPKLAQIILNLAVGKLPSEILASICDIPAGEVVPRPRIDQTVLDPFCGTGVVLQEALLMGYRVHGSDLEPRMAEYSTSNLRWLRADNKNWQVEVGDATAYNWKNFDTIASETYLGRPFSALPGPNVLQKVIQDVDTIHKKFLQNVASQTKPGFRMCVAVPAWKTNAGFKHLPILDHLKELGYTRSVFVHTSNQDLIYHRPEQIVGRELVILTRN